MIVNKLKILLIRLGFGRCFSPIFISHVARIIPASTCENHSSKTVPVALKFFEMVSKSKTALLALILFLLSSCKSENGKLLNRADSVMEEHPDSAMMILQGIDRHSLKGNELAYYALLYTQSQVKTDIPLDSDSLIRIAYAKYSDDTRGLTFSPCLCLPLSTNQMNRMGRKPFSIIISVI